MMPGPEEPVQGFVDAHCHIDLYKHPQQIIDQAENEHIYTIAVTNAPSVFAHTAALVAQSKYVRAAIGLHPELVHSHKHELETLRVHLSQTRYVGEIGLDYSTIDEEIRSAQRQVLSTIASWVNESGDKVLTVHSRRATRDVISILSGINAKVILHWFSGTKKELDRAIGSGFFFSVNSAMLHSEAGRALVLQMPRERVLTETDGPFVHDGAGPATPTTVKATVRGLADLWGQLPDDVQAATIDNFRMLLGSSQNLFADSR
jgi:TatD DNase family protein